MKRTDDQIRCQFFKQLSAAERLKVLRVFLDISDAAAAEVNSHSIEAKLLSRILRPTAPASGVALPFPALPLPIARHEEIGPLFDRTAMHQYALRYSDMIAATTPRAANDVIVERRRQVEAEGYETEHDDAHPNGEIAAYAAFYAMPEAVREWPATETGYGDTFGQAIIPADWTTPKPGNRRRELVKAGALVLAEIERLDRASEQQNTTPQGVKA